MKTNPPPSQAERPTSIENRSVGEILSDRGQSEDLEFPMFAVSKDSPPITFEMVKAALDDDI